MLFHLFIINLYFIIIVIVRQLVKLVVTRRPLEEYWQSSYFSVLAKKINTTEDRYN